MSHGQELLRILSDGRFHSGAALGKSLGVRPALVGEYVQDLRAAGLQIDVMPGHGYQLTETLELLSTEAIAQALAPATRASLGPLTLHYEIDSTNSELLRSAAALPCGAVCLAEAQRAGRGRQGRRWVSPCARNIYLSLLWRFTRSPDALTGLALSVGLAVLSALEDVGVRGAAVKWPNDVIWRGAKLAGTLIEASNGAVVIGVGINVAMPRAQEAIGQSWVDAASAAGKPVSRNHLAAALLDRLVETLARFDVEGLAAFMAQWRKHDALHGCSIAVLDVRGTEMTGVARGIDVDGALLVEHQNGELRRYLSGDVSVRSRAQRTLEEAAST
ncbi:MAG: biotin--[acetyl-CoA-carboxylase] ligase [Chromatiales bacterium]|jgi:BirA family biotin operon repressor/biotin-[acetyl-CoA-carboxylase] ligase|nr:biotin--[acetyl-CoA-carboxylase] ligase [Chromatiales bacterium]